jgi:hypothetical protein
MFQSVTVFMNLFLKYAWVQNPIKMSSGLKVRYIFLTAIGLTTGGSWNRGAREGKHYVISTLRRPQGQPKLTLGLSVFTVLVLESVTAFAYPVAHGNMTGWFVILAYNV